MGSKEAETQMNLSGIYDFGSMQAPSSWPEVTFPSKESLQLLPHVGVSGTGRKVLVSPRS